MIALPPEPTLFPYTTLFRSGLRGPHHGERRVHAVIERQVLEYGNIEFVLDHRARHMARKRRMAPERRNLARTESRSEEHTSELQSQSNLVCRLLLEKKKKK